MGSSSLQTPMGVAHTVGHFCVQYPFFCIILYFRIKTISLVKACHQIFSFLLYLTYANVPKMQKKKNQLKVGAIAITNVFITKYAQNFHQSLVPQRTKKNNTNCKIQPSVQMTRTRPKTHLKFLQTFIILREDNYEKKNLASAAVTAANEYSTSCLVISIEHAHDFIYRRHPGRNKQQFFRSRNVKMHVIPCRSKSLYISCVVSHFY